MKFSTKCNNQEWKKILFLSFQLLKLPARLTLSASGKYTSNITFPLLKSTEETRKKIEKFICEF